MELRFREPLATPRAVQGERYRQVAESSVLESLAESSVLESAHQQQAAARWWAPGERLGW